MSTEFHQIGRLLKKRREDLHLSLKEVENATSIRTSYLQSLEEGRFESLISPIYAQGFLKKYASFLQLDENRILQECPPLDQVMAKPVKEEFDFSNLGSIEVRGSSNKDQKKGSALLIIGGSSLAVLAIWWIIRSLGIF